MIELKTLRVIDSCKNLDQLRVAARYVELAAKQINSEKQRQLFYSRMFLQRLTLIKTVQIK